jgi:hypothetical protein
MVVTHRGAQELRHNTSAILSFVLNVQAVLARLVVAVPTGSWIKIVLTLGLIDHRRLH